MDSAPKSLNTSQMVLEKKIEKIQRWLEVMSSQFANYHNHKESMAHAIFAVELAWLGFFLGGAVFPEWSVNLIAKGEFYVVFLIVLLVSWLIHIFLLWQLRMRRVASAWVDAANLTLLKWAQITPEEEAFTQETSQSSNTRRFGIKGLFDFLFFPLFRNYPTSASDAYILHLPKDVRKELLISVRKINISEKILASASFLMLISSLIVVYLRFSAKIASPM